jgi:hypothetical protein
MTYSVGLNNAVRTLQNSPFYPISVSDSNLNPPPNFGGLILEILIVFMWLKFLPFLKSNKNIYFSKVSLFTGNAFNHRIIKNPVRFQSGSQCIVF